MNNLLVLGVGNEVLTDDGIGPKIIHQLKNKFSSQSNIHFETACCGGLQILEMITSYKKVILVDAIKTKIGIPGSVYFLCPENFKETSHLSSAHDISFLNALKLGEQLGFEMPEEISIVAIEVEEDRELSESFSPMIEEEFPKIKSQVLDHIKHYTTLSLN